MELGLYLPRIGFALPLLPLLLLLLVLRMWRLLWSQLLAALLVVFPLMGFVVSWPARAGDPKRTLRVLSYNGNMGYGGQDQLAREVLESKPDVAVFQQLYWAEDLSKRIAALYPVRQTNGEFFIASRFPVRGTVEPAKLPHGGRQRSPRFIKYEIEAPFGRVALYNVHPISPSYQISVVRSGGLRRAIASGSVFSLKPRPELEGDTLLRSLQTRTAAEMAERETIPVIIAGDTNLPALSGTLRHLKRFQDGFDAAGFGFGYTFPTKRPWMRIDRVFASDHFRFVNFQVGESRASDHLSVVAELERR